MIAQRRAFRDDSCAPAWSPTAHLPLTWAAKTMLTMPGTGQQRIVVRMAQTRLDGGGGLPEGPTGAESYGDDM